MDIRELITGYEKYLNQINDIWRSLWPRRKTRKIRQAR